MVLFIFNKFTLLALKRLVVGFGFMCTIWHSARNQVVYFYYINASVRAVIFNNILVSYYVELILLTACVVQFSMTDCHRGVFQVIVLFIESCGGQ